MLAILPRVLGSYSYAGVGYANPHAVTGVGGTTYTYDNNGNVTAIGSLDYTWDWRNRLASAERSGGGTTSYGYDHTGQRMFKATGTATTSYPNRYSNLATTTGSATTTKHIFAPDGTLLATVEGSGVGPDTTTYLHADHLGGTNVTTDEDGEVTQTLDYYPFGAERINQGSNSTDRHYIGERYDGGEDLSYLNARYYRGAQGQFLSQDPVFLALGDPGRMKQMTQLDLRDVLADPQAMNSYSYARNNPITLKDPEGEFFKKEGQLAYELVRGAFGGYGNIQTVSEFNMLIDQLTADGNWSPSDGRRLGIFISKGILEYVCDFVCDLVRAGADINSLPTRTPGQTVSGGGSGSILQPHQVVTGPTNQFGLPTFLFVPPLPPPPPPPPSAPPSSSGSGGSGSSSPSSGPRGLPPPPPPPPPPFFR
jgi:RHS repeat-associated protein